MKRQDSYPLFPMDIRPSIGPLIDEMERWQAESEECQQIAAKIAQEAGGEDHAKRYRSKARRAHSFAMRYQNAIAALEGKTVILVKKRNAFRFNPSGTITIKTGEITEDSLRRIKRIIRKEEEEV